MGYGGEFLATPDADLSYLFNNYDSKATLNNGFFSFCLERDANITFDVPHNAVLNDEVVGVGGDADRVDPLSQGSAWLYEQFSTGVLDGYDYTAGDRSTAGALQVAIWWLEDEANLIRPLNNYFLNLAANRFGTALLAKEDNNGSFAVSVLNLGRSPDSPIQDLLAYTGTPGTGTPVPDGANTFYILSIGMGGLMLISRKINSPAPQRA